MNNGHCNPICNGIVRESEKVLLQEEDEMRREKIPDENFISYFLSEKGGGCNL